MIVIIVACSDCHDHDDARNRLELVRLKPAFQSLRVQGLGFEAVWIENSGIRQFYGRE